MRVRLTKRAQAQVDRAANWWDDNRSLAPEAFDEELSEAFSLLAVEPGIGVPVTNTRTPGVKRLHLARTHYFLYYRVHGEEVQVLRIWHTSRGTDPREVRIRGAEPRVRADRPTATLSGALVALLLGVGSTHSLGAMNAATSVLLKAALA
ncbi:MAG: type II toxin-antitoxin system RelE/ParE family toxin [Burkholderiales bacterium]